ncbi:MAG: hypothetical protein VX130_07190 [Verrucomicrobiota bacterium]|nr:hypothetical protein [Verrucomicrobiota bacterium]
MGLLSPILDKLVETVTKTKLLPKDRLLVLGQQDALIDPLELKRIIKKYSLNLSEKAYQLYFLHQKNKDHYKANMIIYRDVLGFNQVFIQDVSDYEGADILFDLNEPAPSELMSSFDLILDCGTIEHIFDVKQVFSNLFSMIRLHGIIIHFSPFNIWPEHGFYCYNPTLFKSIYIKNYFKINELSIYSIKDEKDWNFIRYEPSIMNPDNSDYWKQKMGIFCVAKKVQKESSLIVPQQEIYESKLWKYPYPTDIESESTINRIELLLLNFTERLIEQKLNEQITNVAIYGDGKHTTWVLDALRNTAIISPSTIITTATTKPTRKNLTYTTIDKVNNDDFSIIILSSHLYEKEMFFECRSKNIQIPILKLYDNNTEDIIKQLLINNN